MAGLEAGADEPEGSAWVVSSRNLRSEVFGRTQEDSRTHLCVAAAILNDASAVLGVPVILQKLEGPRNDFTVDVNLPGLKQACFLAVHKMKTYSMEQVMSGDIELMTIDSFEDDEVKQAVKFAIEERMRSMIFGRHPAKTRARQLKKFPTKDDRMAIVLSCPAFNEQMGRVLAVIEGEDPSLPVMLRKADLDLGWAQGGNADVAGGMKKRGQELNEQEFTRMVDLLERILQGLPDSNLKPFPVSEDGKRSIRDKLRPVVNQVDGDTDEGESSLGCGEHDRYEKERVPVKDGKAAAVATQERQHIVCHDTGEIGHGMAISFSPVEQRVEQCPVFPWCDQSQIAAMLPLFFDPDPSKISHEPYLKLMCIVVHICRECNDEDNCPVKKALVRGYAPYDPFTSYRKCRTLYCSDCKVTLCSADDVQDTGTFLIRAIMENCLNRVRETDRLPVFSRSLAELISELESLSEHQTYVLLTVVRFTQFHYQETLDTVRDLGEHVTIALVLQRLWSVRGLPIFG